MAVDKEKLTELRDDLEHGQRVVLAIDYAICAASFAAVLLIAEIDEPSWAPSIAAALFAVSMACWGMIVLARHHVLAKGRDLHIFHAIVLDDEFKHTRTIGFGAFAFAFPFLLWSIQPVVAVVGIVAAGFAWRRFLAFKKEFKGLMDGRKVEELMNEAQRPMAATDRGGFNAAGERAADSSKY